MKKVIRLTESDLNRLVKKVIKEDDDESELQLKRGIKRRINNNEILDLISQAKEETDEDDFSDYFEYLENVIYWVVQELQSLYGDTDDFFYDYEDEITDYLKTNFDDDI